MALFRRSTKEAYVFVSYRRRDSEAAGRLAAELDAAFGEDHVFFDVDDIHAGARWSALLDTQVLASDVVVAAITENWLAELRARRGKQDFVLRELSLALRENISVVPVFFPGASLSRGDLPDEISDLMHFQGIEVGESLAEVGDLVQAIDQLVGEPDRDGRRRKVNEAKVMAQWFDTAAADEEVLARASGTKTSDPVLILSPRRAFIGRPDASADPAQVGLDDLYAVRFQNQRLWLLGLDFEHDLQRLRVGSPGEVAAELERLAPTLDIASEELDDALLAARRIDRARQHLDVHGELLACTGDEDDSPVLFITPESSVVARRKKDQEGALTVPHEGLAGVCVHKRTLWLLGPHGEHKIDALKEPDLDQVTALLMELASHALLFRKPPDRAVRESLMVLDPNGLAAEQGIDLGWTVRMRPTDEEAVLLAAAKLRLMEEDLGNDPDWDDRIAKRKTVDVYVRALVAAFASEVDEDQKPLGSLQALRKSTRTGAWAARFKATLGEMDPEDARRALLDDELQANLLRSVTRRDRALIQLVELTSFYPWPAGTKFEKGMRELTCRLFAEDMAAEVESTDFDFIDQELKRRAKVLGGKGANWAILVPLFVGGAAIGVATGGLATPFIGGALGSAMGLSGAAATSAGLALLGGGSLAAGGAGMAGGMALIGVLGGVLGAGAGIATGKAVDISREGLLTESVKLDLLSELVLLSERNEARQVASVIALLKVQTARLGADLAKLQASDAEPAAEATQEGRAKSLKEAREDLTDRFSILTGLHDSLSRHLAQYLHGTTPLEAQEGILDEIAQSGQPSLLVGLRMDRTSVDVDADASPVVAADLIGETRDPIASILIDARGSLSEAEGPRSSTDLESRVKSERFGGQVTVVGHPLLWSSVAGLVTEQSAQDTGDLATALDERRGVLPAGGSSEWLDRHGVDFKKLAKAVCRLLDSELGAGEPVMAFPIGDGVTLSVRSSRSS